MLKEEESDIDLGEYGLGKKRTHHDYELYTGIDFRNRVIHKRALEGEDPKIVSEEEWLRNTLEIITHKEHAEEYVIKAEWEPEDMPEDNYKFWYFGVEDDKEQILFRKDFTPESDPLILRRKLNSFTTIISSSKKPVKWVLWGYSNNVEGGWSKRIEKYI